MGLINAWQASQLLDGRTRFTLGPYRIVDSLGQGGMGQVFKAEQTPTGLVVAVKVLPKAKSTPEAVKSFENEMRALARMDHHKLVRAIDMGHDGNVHYLVTEYVPGCDLRKLVRRDGPLNMEQAAAILYQVAEGLAHAHARGLIHRDVKPGNVLVTPEGEAKLSDLGLAGPIAGDAEKDPRFGKIVGTADYLSPDHIKTPWDPQPAWDIYSLGCTLYYAVTGKVPFPGGTTSDKARAHCELRPLDPRRLTPNLSAPFVDLMADMMAKDSAQRIRTADEVMVRLLPWIKRPLPESSANRAFSPVSLEHQFAPLAVPPGLGQDSSSAVAMLGANGPKTDVPQSAVDTDSELQAKPLDDTIDDGAQQMALQVAGLTASCRLSPPPIVADALPTIAPPPIIEAPPIVVSPIVVPGAAFGPNEESQDVSFWQRHRLVLLMVAVGIPAILLFLAVVLVLGTWLAR